MSGLLNPSGTLYTWPQKTNPGFRTIQSQYLKSVGKSRTMTKSFPKRADRVPEQSNKMKFDIRVPTPAGASGAVNRSQAVTRNKAILQASLTIQPRL